jgi:L-rhamnose isomerase (EC 5.3.1.14)
MTKLIEQAFELAKQRYAALGIDVDQVMTQLDGIPVSMHCWQGDDVRGFENPNGELTAVFRPPAIIRDALATRMSCVRT